MLPRSPIVVKLIGILLFITMILVCVVFFRREATIQVLTRDTVLTFTPGPVSVSSEITEKNEPESVEESTTGTPTQLPMTMATSIITTTAETTTTTTTEVPTNTNIKLFINAGTFKYVLPHETQCENSTYIMIYIHSAPENTERRLVVRTTWASAVILEKYKMKLMFVMGEVDDEKVQSALENENSYYQDIVQANFTDTYRNLTYKAIAGLKWVSENCPEAVYVLKTDDDIIVDIHRLVLYMKSYMEHKHGRDNLLVGHLWTHMDVDRNKNSKWYTSEVEYPNRFYTTYCSGSAFIMSSDVVQKFHQASFDTPFFWVDDYYVTGMLSRAANVTATNMNDRYVLVNKADIIGSIRNDAKTRLVFIHSPNSTVSRIVWQMFLDRW